MDRHNNHIQVQALAHTPSRHVANKKNKGRSGVSMTMQNVIDILHNRQYMVYKGQNGEAVFIHPLTDKECKQIEALLTQQQAEVEGLMCCGNCKWYRVIINDGKCFEGLGLPPDVWRFDNRATHVDGDGKCDKWEAYK